MTTKSQPKPDCIISRFKPRRDGYAAIGLDGKKKLHHRVVLEKKLGRPIRDGYCALHTCDVRNCINPDHLWEGTQQDNIWDAQDKGRWNAWGTNEKKAQTHCIHGHEFTEANTYTYKKQRHCKACERERYWNKKGGR